MRFGKIATAMFMIGSVVEQAHVNVDSDAVPLSYKMFMEGRTVDDRMGAPVNDWVR